MSVTSTVVILLLVISVAQSQPPPRLRCTEDLVLFSPCLPYVSAPPNNLTAMANPQCCSVFSSSIDSGDGICLCYLLRQPMILGFPLDRLRVLSLSQICSDGSSIHESLESLCSISESPELPPLQSIQFTTPSVPGDGRVSTSAPPSVGLPPESDETWPTADAFSPEAALRSPPPPLQPPQSVSQGSSVLSGNSKPPNTINFWFLSGIAVSASSFLFSTAM